MKPPLAQSAVDFTVSAVLIGAAGAGLVYYGQVDTGLYYDDYHFLRPVHPLEFRRVWYGSWDPTGIESDFFRPITAWLFALRFWSFALNTQALHAVSIVGHVLCATLAGWFLRREQAPAPIGLMAVWLYAIHPLFPYAQVSWLTNQMHVAESLVVLVALLTWQRVRARQLRWHLLLLPLAAIAFLIKEDAVMLLPVIVALTMLRGWLVDHAQRRSAVALLPLAAIAVGVLIGFRHVRLGRLGGYGRPDLEQATTQFWRGLDAALLLWPTRTPWQALAAAIAIVAVAVALVRARRMGRVVALVWGAAAAALAWRLPALLYEIEYPLFTWQGIASGTVMAATLTGAGLAAGRRSRRPLLIMVTGLIVAVGFNLPFALVSKREQYHLVALGSVLVLAGVIDALRSVASRASRLVLPAAAVASLPLALLARDQAAAFRPCAPAVLANDGEASGWWVVPGEIRAWLAQKKERCAQGLQPGRLADIPVVMWGTHEEERGSDRVAYRWTSDRSVLLISLDTPHVSLAFRSPGATPSNPVHVAVTGGTRAANLVLDSDEWKYLTLRFSRDVMAMLRSAHRVDISVTPWFVPAARDPQQMDLRRFGAHFRIVEN